MPDDSTLRESAQPGGFLYVLTNPWMPGILKIGQTERHPSARASELSDHTGVPGPFEVAFYFDVGDRFSAEAQIHDLLELHRVSSAREFFKISPDQAMDVIAASLGRPRSDARLPPPPPNYEGITLRAPKDFCDSCGRIHSRCSCVYLDPEREST